MKSKVKDLKFLRKGNVRYKIKPLELSHIVHKKERRGARLVKLILCPLNYACITKKKQKKTCNFLVKKVKGKL